MATASLDLQDEKLECGECRVAREGVCPHSTPGYCSGKWSHVNKFASITLIQTLRNGHVPSLPSPPIVKVTVTGRTLFLFEGHILKRRVLTLDPEKEIYDHHL